MTSKTYSAKCIHCEHDVERVLFSEELAEAGCRECNKLGARRELLPAHLHCDQGERCSCVFIGCEVAHALAS